MANRAWTALWVCLLIFGIAGTVTAQSDYKVVAIEVEGNLIASKTLILGVTSIYIGSPLNQTAIQESIKRLYGLGIFYDVQIEAEEVTGGLKAIVVVIELPKLIGLDITGNKKIKTKDIKESLGLGIGGYISPFLVHEKRQKIIDKYAEKGYFQATVTGSLDYNTDSTEATLIYSVVERSKVKVKSVVITGNERVETNTLIKKMRNRKRGFLKSSDFAQDKYEEDLEKVIATYHNLGYIDAYMISDSTSINDSTNRMIVYLEVYEGPMYYFGDISFEGTKILPEEFLSSLLKYETGKSFNSDEYDESLMELYTAYQDVGRLHVQVYDERTTRDSLIDVKYSITEGLPSHIRHITIVGNTKTKEKVIRRELRVYPGQIFNRSLLIRSIREAMALNYFAGVEPIPIDLPNGDVDVEFKIEEKQTGQISAGAGYNSTDKMVGSVGMGIPNLGGNGQNLSFNIEFGKNRNSLNVSFTEPYLFGRPTLLGTDVFAMRRRWFSDYTESRQGAAIRLGRRLKWPDSYTRAFIGVNLERNKFADFDDSFEQQNSYANFYDTTYVFHQTDTARTIDSTSALRGVSLGPHPGSILTYQERWNTAAKLSFTVARDSRNLPEFATRGSKIAYTISQTGGPFGGFWEYRKHSFSVAKFVPLFWKFALAARVQFGAIESPFDSDSTVLISDRYTPGGTAYDGIVRGYDDGSLTPDSIITQSDTTFTIRHYTDIDDNIIIDRSDTTTQSFKSRVRGNFMFVTNIEVQFPIVERSIYGIFFFDAGNSWLDIKDFRSLSDLYSGAGAGFRIVVPGIGTIGLDFAKPLQNPPNGDDRGWRTHFQIGTTFR